MKLKPLIRTAAAAAAGFIMSQSAAWAETYRMTGNLTYDLFYSHGATSSLDLLIETDGPLTIDGVATTAVSGTFMGQTVTGLMPSFYNTPNLLFSLYGVDYDGLSISFEPLTGSRWSGQNDSVANIWSSDGLEYYAYLGIPTGPVGFSSSYAIQNFSLTPVPEPEGYALMLAGLAALGAAARRRAGKR